MKRLITDRDVMTGAVSPPLVLDENTLITPSARERAMRLGWTITEAGGRAAPASAAMSMGVGAACARCGATSCSGGCCAASPGATGACGNVSCSGGLADGLYLVRIEGGRRVEVLPAAGPGVMARALQSLPAPSAMPGGRS
jgi:hypothetical protein